MHPVGVALWFVDNNAVIAERMPFFGMCERLQACCRMREYEADVSLAVEGCGNESDDAVCGADKDDISVDVGVEGFFPIIGASFPDEVDVVLVEAVSTARKFYERSGPGWKVPGVFYAVVEFNRRVREIQRSSGIRFRDSDGYRTLAEFRARVKAIVLYEFGHPARLCSREFMDGSQIACFSFEGLLNAAKGLSEASSADRLYAIRCLLSDFRNALAGDSTWRNLGSGLDCFEYWMSVMHQLRIEGVEREFQFCCRDVRVQVALRSDDKPEAVVVPILPLCWDAAFSSGCWTWARVRPTEDERRVLYQNMLRAFGRCCR